MPELVWGNPLDKRYESGLDKGVLYLPDGTAVPWNGLISISEKFNQDSETVYFDGMKISVIVSSGDFEANLKAASYPKEFDEIQGYAHLRKGVKLRDQMPQFFGMCWRTFKGNEAGGPEAGYKINVAYNLIATPSDRAYETKSDDPSLVEFEWDICSGRAAGLQAYGALHHRVGRGRPLALGRDRKEAVWNVRKRSIFASTE